MCSIYCFNLQNSLYTRRLTEQEVAHDDDDDNGLFAIMMMMMVVIFTTISSSHSIEMMVFNVIFLLLAT